MLQGEYETHARASKDVLSQRVLEAAGHAEPSELEAVRLLALRRRLDVVLIAV